MKKIYNYILLSALAFASASCINEEFNPDQPTAETGDEVKFGLSLGDPKTKTVYGDETDNHTFPIYWIDGDKVQVFSPQCLEGRRSAEYKVILPSGATNPNYAEDLAKTGEYGVQWGNNETADFYSLYPSGNYTLSSDGSMAENITIGYTQSINVNGTTVKSDMEDCLMYAKTTGVQKGQIVNLHYDPISTVIMLTLKVDENVTGTAADSFTIQSITLTAPEGTDIAGTFSLNISKGTFGGFTEGKASNTIITQIVNTATGGYHTLANGQSVTVPLFLAPAEYTSVKDWKVQVVANGNTYTKTLNIEKALEPGQIHKITLPKLKPAATEWDVSKWMTYIPRNVYLSEVSIPGSWNSLNKDFQGDNPSIESQYTAGVRAFHLDTRWSTTVAAGYSIADKYYLPSDLSSSNMYLSVRDAGTGRDVRSKAGLGVIGSGESLGQIMDQNNPSFSDYLSKITGQVKKDEYMVLFCSFAQGSYNDVAVTGRTWIKAISDACAKNDLVYNAQNITQNTVVGDVLNSVIVIVNCENPIANENLPENSKCLFVHIPNHLTSDYFPEEGFKSDNLHTSSSTSQISMAVSQAQITSSTGSAIVDGTRGYYPSFDERTRVVNAILDWSQNDYNTNKYAHDKWIYLGLGGSTGSSKNSTGDSNTSDDVAAVYSPLIDSRIEKMGVGNTPFYPLGIVYLNYTTTESMTVGSTTFSPKKTVKNILLLNNKYRLQYDSSKPSDYNPQALSLAEYGATATVGGDAF